MGGRGREVRMAWPCHSREENATSSAVPARVSRGPAAGKTHWSAEVSDSRTRRAGGGKLPAEGPHPLQ